MRNVSETKKQSWERFLLNITSESSTTAVWKHIIMLKNKPSSKVIIFKENGQFFTSPREVSEILANHYANRNIRK